MTPFFFYRSNLENNFIKSFFFYILINFIDVKYINLLLKPEFYRIFKILHKTYRITKNYRRIFRKIKRRKNYLRKNYRTGYVKLKFGNFFYFAQKKSPQSFSRFYINKIKKHSKWFTHFFFLSYRHFFYRRWFPLTGISMSPMFFGLREKKRWLAKNLRCKLRTNYKYKRTFSHRTRFLKIRTHKLLTENKTIISKRLTKRQLKKIYYDNMFYFIRIKIRFRRLKFFIKLIRFKFPPNTRRNIYHKSYLFLNNVETRFKKTLFPLKKVYRLFKLHKKLFRILKRRNSWTRKWAHIWFKSYSNINSRRNKQLITFGPKVNIKQRLRTFYNSKLIVIKRKNRYKKISSSSFTFFVKKKKKTWIKRRMRIKWRKLFLGYWTRRSRKQIVYRKLKKLLRTSIFNSKKLFSKRIFFFRYIGRNVLRILRKVFKRRRNRRWYNWRITRKFRKWNFWTLANKNIGKISNRFIRYRCYRFVAQHKFVKTNRKLIFHKRSIILKTFLWSYPLKKIFSHCYLFLTNFNLKYTPFNVTLKYIQPAFIKSAIYSLLKKPVLTPTHRSNYILYLSGFLLTTNTLLLNYNNKNKQLVYLIKQKLFSFTYKSDMRRHLLRKSTKWRSSSILVSYFRKKRSLRWKKSYNPIYKELKLSTKLSSLTLNEPISNLRSMLSRRFSSSHSTSIVQYIKRKKFGKKYSKLKIPVIKFKPGLSTWWRRARRSLVQGLNLKFRYQHRLTKFIINYRKILHKKFLPVFEMRLFNILVRTRLILDQITSKKFIDNRLVFVNGVCCVNRNLQLFTNDFLQLIVTYKYYIIFRWLLNYSIKMKKRIKHFSWKNKQRKRRPDKQWSYRLQKSVLPHKHLILDVAKYLEVDFFTLSAFILYDPFLWNDLDRYNVLSVQYGIINLYNWKYIT